MATITLKNIPDPIYKNLKQLAAEQHRSINSQVIYLIEKAAQSTKVDPNQHLLAARKFRAKTAQHSVSNDILTEIKNQGRP